MDNSHLAILLLLIGLALLIAEIFIPSGGLILVGALLCLGGSVWYAWHAWAATRPGAWWTYLGALLLLLPAVVIGAFYIFPRTPWGRSILLEAPRLEDVTPYAEATTQLTKLVGQMGTTLTMLNPGGLVSVNRERLHCESEGMLIEAGKDVQIVAVKGNRLVVRSVSRRHQTDNIRMSDRSEPPLDFELPQS